MMNDFGEHIYIIHDPFLIPFFLVSSFLPSTIPLTRSAYCLSLALFGYGRQNLIQYSLLSFEFEKHINLYLLVVAFSSILLC